MSRMALRSNLTIRLLSSSAILPVVAVILYIGGLALTACLIVIAAAMAWEWTKMLDGSGLAKRFSALAAILTGLLTALVLSIELHQAAISLVFAVAGSLIIFGAVLWRQQAERPLLLILGLPIIVVGCAAVGVLRGDDHSGLVLVLWGVGAVIATDTGGYIFGRLIGGPRLAPRVSPAKTWSGLLGGAALAAIFGGVLAQSLGGITPAYLALWSALLAVISQAGDLAESAVKRHVGVKDSGSLIPGHGGLLDRLDGHLAALPMVLAIAVFTGRNPIEWSGF